MTKTNPESDFFIMRKDRNQNSFSIIKNNGKMDLTGFVYLKTNDNNLEEWVKQEDYDFYKEQP